MYRSGKKGHTAGLITNPNLLGLSPAPYRPYSLLHPLSGNIFPPHRCSGISHPCMSHSLLLQLPGAGSYLCPQTVKLFGLCEDEALAQPHLSQPQESSTLQAEGFQAEFCAVEDHKAVRVLGSEARILLVAVKVPRVPPRPDLLDLTDVH